MGAQISKKDAIKIVVVLLKSHIRVQPQAPQLDDQAASLGEGANRRGDVQMEQARSTKCCITWAAILKLYLPQIQCLTLSHGFLQETEILSGTESIIQHCNGQNIMWS